MTTNSGGSDTNLGATSATTPVAAVGAAATIPATAGETVGSGTITYKVWGAATGGTSAYLCQFARGGTGAISTTISVIQIPTP